MNCYFCKNEIYDKFKIASKAFNGYCDDCAALYNHEGVITSYNEANIIYVHIYTKLNDYSQFHLRLHMYSGELSIRKYIYGQVKEGYIEVLTIKDANITPANAKSRLQTILVFS